MDWIIDRLQDIYEATIFGHQCLQDVSNIHILFWRKLSKAERQEIRDFIDGEPSIFENDDIITKDLLITNYVTFGKMFRNIKNIIKDWMMGLPYYDWPLNYELSRHGKIKFLNCPMGVYRYHNNGIFSLLSTEEQKKISLFVL